jgi:chromosomal replication initiation ATPase DnaA
VKAASSITQIALDKRDKTALARAGAPVSGLRKVIQQISDRDRLVTLEAKVEKLEAQISAMRERKFHPRDPAILNRIRDLVCQAAGIGTESFGPQRSTEKVSRVKFSGCWLAVELTGFTTTEIAAVFGLARHCSVIYGAKRMREIMAVEQGTEIAMHALRDQLKKEFGL